MVTLQPSLLGDSQLVLRHGACHADVRHLSGRGDGQSRQAVVRARDLLDVPVPGQHRRDHMHLHMGVDRLVRQPDVVRPIGNRHVRLVVAGRVHAQPVQHSETVQLAETSAHIALKDVRHQFLPESRRSE